MADDVTIGNKALHHQVADFIKIPLIWLKISSFKNHDCVQVFFQVLISASSSLSDCFSLSLSSLARRHSYSNSHGWWVAGCLIHQDGIDIVASIVFTAAAWKRPAFVW